MAKFNTKKVSTEVKTRTTNRAGGKAYELDKKTELVTILLTEFVSDQFYRSKNDTIGRVRKLIAEISDKQFVAKAAVFARNECGMRSISHSVAAEIAKSVKGEVWTKYFFDKIVRRPDDMLEILSIIRTNRKIPIPNSLKKGFRKAFNKFDTYQLSKYTANRSEFSLVDLVNLVCPCPTERNAEGLKALVKDKLVNQTTSQRVLTSIGQSGGSNTEKAEKRGQYWKDVLTQERIGYTDLIRSLTKIAKEADAETVDKACESLTHKVFLKKSMLMPYTFVIAMKMVQQEVGSTSAGRKITRALNKALDMSVENVPVFDGNTVVIIDYSGSMQAPVSNGNVSVMNRAEAGTIMGSVLAKSNDADMMIFASTAKYLPVNTDDTISTIVKDKLNHTGTIGYATNLTAAFNKLNKKYDRVIILSDMQAYIGDAYRAFKSYRSKYKVNPYVYSYDLSGYGSVQIPESNTFVLGGFSEKVFNIMELLEEDKKALVKKIEEVELA